MNNKANKLKGIMGIGKRRTCLYNLCSLRNGQSMDFCRARPGVTERNRRTGWGTHPLRALSTKAHWEFRYSIAEPRPSWRWRAEEKMWKLNQPCAFESWETPDGWGSWDCFSRFSPSHHLGYFIGDALPDNLKYSLPCAHYFTHCVVIFFVFICIYVYCLPD